MSQRVFLATANEKGEVELPPSVVTTSAPGFAPSVIWLDTTPEFYGAVGDGVTDDTAAFQAADAAIVALGGGTIRASYKTYLVDGYVWSGKVNWESPGRRAILKAKAGSANEGLVMLTGTAPISCGWKNFVLEGAGNANQDGFYLFAGGEVNGGLNQATFENVQVGTRTHPFLRNGMWFRGGSVGTSEPHQFITFRRVTIVRPNTGEAATTSRALKLTGQCEKFEFDTACIFHGAEHEKEISGRVGTNIEIGREFLLATTLKAEAKAAATTIEVNSTEGWYAGRVFTVGEGATQDLCQAEKIEGNVVTLKAALVFTHATGQNVYQLTYGSGKLAKEAKSGATEIEVAAGSGLGSGATFTLGTGENSEICQVATNGVSGAKVKLKAALAKTHATEAPLFVASSRAPKEIQFIGGAYQTADLQLLVDAGATIDFLGTDFEEQNRVARVRSESLGVNLKAVHVDAASEGTSNGNGVVTPGSAVVTGCTGIWEVGNNIAGPGVPLGVTVTKVEGETIELSAPVEANGVTSESVSLIKASKGEGYIALYEGKSSGRLSYFIGGLADRTVINRESSARLADLSRTGGALATIPSSGITLALATATALSIQSAREVVLTDAAKEVSTLKGFHATGEEVTLRATVGGTKIVTGGNINLPTGNLTLAAGDTATFLCTDNGTMRWTLINVQRANEIAQLLLDNGLLYPENGLAVPSTEAAIGSANHAWTARTRPAQVAGHIKGLLLAVGKTVSAGEKVRAAIFDCGATKTGKYTVLWESAEVEVEEAKKETLLSLGEPAVAVALNQQFLFALMTNSTTATFGRTSTLYTGWGILPTGEGEWFPSSGLTKPRLVGNINYGAFSFGGAGTQLTEAENGGGSNAPGLLARVG